MFTEKDSDKGTVTGQELVNALLCKNDYGGENSYKFANKLIEKSFVIKCVEDERKGVVSGQLILTEFQIKNS